MGDKGLRILDEFEERVKAVSDPSFVKKRGDLAIDGRRVMAFMGLPPGPEVGRIMAELVEAVTDQPELNTEQGLMNLLRHMRKASGS
jgi:hypothetical protein